MQLLRDTKRLLRDFLRVEPGVRDTEAAIRSALGVLLPMSALMLAGRPDLMIFSVFGAFTGIYGRSMGFNERLMTQTRAAGLMVTVILLAMLGRLVMGHPGIWAIIAATTVIAGIAAAAARIWIFRPSGSLFHIFAFASISSVPVHPPLWQGLGAALGAAALSILIGAVSNYKRGVRPRWSIPADMYSADALKDALREGAMNALVAGTAGVIAATLGFGVGLGHQYWAMVAAVVPLQALRARHAVFRGTQRILGTLLGLIPLGLILWLDLGPWGTIAAIGVCQFIVELVIIRQYLVAQMFVTPLALLSISLAGRIRPSSLLTDRVGETVIGSVVGMAVLLVVRYPDRVKARLQRG